MQKDIGSTSRISAASTDFRVFEATPGIRAVLSPRDPYTILAISNDALSFTGLSRDQLIGVSVFAMFPANPDDKEFSGIRNLQASFESVLNNKETHHLPIQRYDVARREKEFDEKYWFYTNSPVLGDDGEVKYIIHSAEDITEKVRADKRAILTQSNFEYFLRQAKAPFAILSGKDFKFTFANPAYIELMNGRQLVGKNLVDAIPELKGQPFMDLLEEVFRSGEPWHASEIPATAVYNNSEVPTTRYFNLSYTPFKNEKNETEGIIAAGYDITEQVVLRKEEKIKKQNEQAYNLLMQAPVPIMIYKGEDLVIDMVNDAGLNIAGKKRDVVGRPLAEVLPELEQQGFVNRVKEVMKTGKPFKGSEIPVTLNLNGQEHNFYINVVLQPFAEQDGTISSVISISHDITDLVLVRKRVEASEMHFRNVVEQAPGPILILKGEEMVLDVANEPLLNLWQVGRDAIGKPFLEILPEMEGQGFMELMLDVYRTGKTHFGYETPAVFQRQNGKSEIVFFDYVYQPYRESDGVISGVLVMANNVTEKVLSKRRQQETENNFRHLVMQAPVGICILSAADFNIEIANDSFLELGRISRKELQGVEFIEALPKSVRTRTVEILKSVRKTGKAYYGREFEIEIDRASGKTNLFVDFVYEPILDLAGHVKSIMLISIDVTDKVIARKKIEESEKELQARVKERTSELEKKNSELEQYAQVSSHDLQEPLRKIRMFTDIIKQRDYQNLSEFSREKFDKIIDAVTRMSTSLRELLNFTNLSKDEQFTTVNLNDVLLSVESDLELMIAQKGATINKQDLPQIRAIPLQMHQLFYNLVNNALKFSRPGTHPLIEITCQVVRDKKSGEHTMQPPFVEIVVSDNGIGFEQVYAEKIFTMFQRLNHRQEFSGTGIGLALCKKVVVNHGGEIFATSEPGKGSTFHILLPGS